MTLILTMMLLLDLFFVTKEVLDLGDMVMVDGEEDMEDTEEVMEDIGVNR